MTIPITRRLAFAFFLTVSAAGAINAAGLTVGETFPSFYLKDLDGNNFFYNEYIGDDARFETRAVIFSFGASYCEPCKREIPELEKLADKYRDAGLRVFIVAMEREDRARELVAATGTTLPVLLDRYLVVQNLIGFEGIPYTVLLDGDGIVRFINTGFSEEYVSEAMAPFEDMLGGMLGAGGGPAAGDGGDE